MAITPDQSPLNPPPDGGNEIAALRQELAAAQAARDAAVAEAAALAAALRAQTAELQETQEQQTAMAEVLEAINTSGGDLSPVFETVLEKAMRLCDAPGGIFWSVNGSIARMAASRGYPEPYAEFLKTPFEIGPHTGIGRLLRGENRVLIDDIAAGVGYASGDPLQRAAVDLANLRTLAAVALRKDGVLIGAFAMGRLEVRPFHDRQVALLENFAAQAVIAMENARLITEQQEALEQQTATAEVLGVINANPGELAPVFGSILEKAMQLCGVAFGEFYTYENEIFQLTTHRGLPAEAAALRMQPTTIRPGTMAWRLREGERIIHIPDLRAEAAYQASDRQRQALVDEAGARTVLNVALRRDGVLRGCIIVYRTEVKPFDARQITLLENFAAQAVIAMENARLINETREALEQQTATAEVLGVINASPGELAPVFDAILEKAMRLCGASFGGLNTWDREYWRPVARCGYPAPFERYQATKPPTTVPPPLILRMFETKQTQQIADLKTSEGYRTGHPDTTALVELGGARTGLFVPLVRDDVAIGNITVYRQEVWPFSAKEIALLENFAAQAVIAMENARLINETREALEQQTATAEVLGVINASQGDLRPVFNTIVEKAIRLCAPAMGALSPFDGEKFQFVVTQGYPRAYVDHIQSGWRSTPGGNSERLMREGGVLHIPDITATPNYENNPNYQALHELGGVRTLLFVPLRTDTAALGLFTLARQEVSPFSAREIELVQNFAAQAVIAMENARLLGELRSALETTQTALRDLKIAQANLVQAEKMASLGQLTAGIAHEIKNPLNFVNNFAALSVDLLAELHETAAPAFATLDDDRRADIEDVSAMLTSNLQKITEHGKRADGIVKAMLEHSRGASGERRGVDINQLTEEALNLAYHGARANDQSFNVTLERDLADNIDPIELNPQDITRVLLNIVGNSFYAVNKRGKSGEDPGFAPTVKVSTRNEGDSVEIRIRDNGTGIPADIRDKLFQPFFTTKPTGEGTGLGLSITYDIVTKAHGGTITVDSEVGAFTEFVVSLPRHMFAREGDRS